MAKLSRGAISLQEYLSTHGMTSQAFALLVPCSETYPWMLAHGKANPGRKMAKRIEQVTNNQVNRHSWELEEDTIEDPINIPELSISELIGRTKK